MEIFKFIFLNWNTFYCSVHWWLMIEAAWLLFSISLGFVFRVSCQLKKSYESGLVFVSFWISVLHSHFNPFTLI